MEYRIFEPNLARLQFELEKLNRKALKLGSAPIVLHLTGKVEEFPIRNEITGLVTRVNRFVWAEFSGSAPKFAGWSLAAVVEHAEEGNILRKSPGCAVELNSFRTGAPRCDHCKALRNRRDTYVVIHENGDQKVIGSNCIKDFLGHANPEQLVRLAELHFSAGELVEGCGEEGFFGGGYSSPLVSVSTLLAFAACAIRRLGYVTSKKARESQEAGGNVCSTGQTASFWMKPTLKAVLGKDYFLPEDCDSQAGEKAREYVLAHLGGKPAEELSDFEHNLLTACRCESVEGRNIGLLAFVPEYYARSIEQAKAAVNETYFGEVGKRARNVPLTYVKSTGWESQYGYTYLHTFSGPNGSRILWKTGTMFDGSAGAEIIATFTPKSHEEYKGHKQTKVSRLTWEPALKEVAA